MARTGLPSLVLQRDLALGVGAEAGFGAGMAGLGKGVQNVVGVVDRRRHQLRRLAAGIAEHDALVARTLVLVAQRIDALGDVRRLLMDEDLDLGVLPVEAVLLIADIADRLARDLLEQLLGDRGGPAHLARQHDLVGGRQRLAGDARIGIGAEIGIDDGVGDAVADLVGMPFGHGFAGEEISFAAWPRAVPLRLAVRERP